MLSRLFETAAIALFNRLRTLPSQSSATAEHTEPSADAVLIGATLPAAGSSPAAAVPVTLEVPARRRHLYVLGATGTGKTNLLLRLLESDIAAHRSFCVVDLRGDLVDRILLRLAERETPETIDDRLLLLDLRQTDHIVGFNPLQGAGDIYTRAFHVLGVVRQQAESWGIQLEETLRNTLLALAETGWSLLEIEPLLTNAAFRSQVLSAVQDSYVRSFFARYDQLSEEKQAAWSLPVFNKVTPLLAIPTLRQMFGQRETFVFSDLLDRRPGQIILVSLAVDRLHQAAYLVGGLLVSAFENAIMARARIPERDRIPVFLYLDEFETMATPSFESIIAEGRRFGLGLTLSHQNGYQIPNNLRHALRNNVHTQFYFQTGALDAADLAAEIANGESREALRASLIGQGVGEAYLIRRGEPSVRVRVQHCPDPQPSSQKIAALQQAAFARYARPQAEVVQELEQRDAAYSARSETPAASASPTYEIRHAKTPAASASPTYEIRHAKTPGQHRAKTPKPL